MKNDHKITALVKGMHCASCAKLIENVISKEPGVKSIRVNQASEEAKLVVEAGLDLQKLNDKIKSYGYSFYTADDATPSTNTLFDFAQGLRDERQKSLDHEKNLALMTFPLSLLIALLMIWEVAANWSEAVPIFFLPMNLYTTISFVLACVVIFAV